MPILEDLEVVVQQIMVGLVATLRVKNGLRQFENFPASAGCRRSRTFSRVRNNSTPRLGNRMHERHKPGQALIFPIRDAAKWSP